MKKFNYIFAGCLIIILIFSGLFLSKHCQVAINQENAKVIALNDAKVTEQEATSLNIKLEYGPNMRLYSIKFLANRLSYDYLIHADTGEIILKHTNFLEELSTHYKLMSTPSSDKTIHTALSKTIF